MRCDRCKVLSFARRLRYWSNWLNNYVMADEIPKEWLEEFEAAAKRPLQVRLRYAFIKTYKPVMDDATFRSFNSMEEYRRWCEENLPRWLGYARI